MSYMFGYALGFGFGYLVFRIRDAVDVIRTVENTDCKKTYGWVDR